MVVNVRRVKKPGKERVSEMVSFCLGEEEREGKGGEEGGEEEMGW